MQIIGSAALRIGAITKDLQKTIQRDVNKALTSIKAPSANALADLQRQLTKGELDLAKAHDGVTEAQKRVKAAEDELNKVRKDKKATTEQVTKAEKAFARATLEAKVAVDKIAAAEANQLKIREKMKPVTVEVTKENDNLAKGNDKLGRSFKGLLGAIGGLTKGFASSVASGMKLLLIGAVAGGAIAGVTSLALSVGALVGALIQASGVAGLLPAAFAGYLAVSATVKLATQGIGDAFSAMASGDAAALAAAMDKLSPSARAFVGQVNKIKPAFDGMRLNVQERAFAGLSESISGLAERYLPVANDLFGGLADSLNGMAREAINFAMSGRALEGTNTIVGNLKASFANMVPAIQPIIGAILDVTSVGSTFLPQLTSSLGGFAQQFGDKIRAMAASGELQAFFERAIEAVKTLGRIAGNVFEGLGGVMRAANAAGGGLLANIESLTQRFADWTNSVKGQTALTSFFESMRRIIEALLPVVLSLAEVFANSLAPILAKIAEVIAPILGPLLEAIGRALDAMAPLIEALSGAFAILLEALIPVFDTLAEALTEIMPELTPIIEQIAEAFAALIEAMAPLIPVFLDLLVAILPILPPLIQMVADLMPQIIELIEILIPVIEAWVQMMVQAIPVFSGFVQFLLAILIPAIQLVAWIFEGVYTVIGAIFTGIGIAFSWLGTSIGQTWDMITGVVGAAADAISSIVSGAFEWIKNVVGNAMNFVLNGVGDAVGGVIDFFVNLPSSIMGVLSNVGSWLVEAGKNAIRGFINGLKAMAGKVIQFFKNMVSDAIDSVLGFLGIGSPSKVFAKIGIDVGRGLILGLRNVTPLVSAAAEKMVATVTAASSPTVGVGLDPSKDNGLSAAFTGALPEPAGGDGASAPMSPEELTEAVAAGMEQVAVVMSDVEVTSRVNRVNRSDARR